MKIQQMKMPQLGESVTEGTISKWLVRPGDHVNKYDSIAEVMTDKVTAEIPSSFTGKIIEIFAKENETMVVGEVICAIEVENVSEKKEDSDQQLVESLKTIETTTSTNHLKTRYSPAVLKISQENGIDLTKVKGSGRDGRITRKDLVKLLEKGVNKIEENQELAPTVIASKQDPVEKSFSSIETSVHSVGDIEIPITGIRKTIAANMVKSKHEVPHAWMMVEVDATNLVKNRDSLKAEFKQKEGYNLTYFAFFIKAVSQALTEFPEMNSMWAGDKIIQKKDINISIAVAASNALFVPVIKHADEKSIKGLAREVHELAQKARTGKLKPEDMQNGTFTVNNTGAFGSIQSMGIINHPQAAILQVESIVKRPVIIDDMIAVRNMVNLCLSIDHRVLDGLVCGKFLARIKEIIETAFQEGASIY
ncbi:MULTISPECIES: dihydrolipoamide acetyltransferase family protein [unclassified Peribacillus]|uniref:dihydrolipoamide acetyltransferase family protein n=1 Tax=unclassified Peribacillus TaxID=2675266 RepID=UPI001912B130|nr:MULTISPECIES: dihydrolipoamide acetyltransferase family protein [unclassified Peribacillus]MBK5446514.1 2-oxo acid dehydrogenase subunit E2 [Peribacillus sp. TH24]MBK5480672.1 2-oxo acid dehydrogenase subunit E2 [Peribacillus sp. TH16]MBK5502172.1 2-oxo acid dehydrogenase subunit E2 [Peribacillus sp. TH14]WMX57844.1 dihydrolipoamide acetyltransferase family protein [Peribacillus sp. R9-11]